MTSVYEADDLFVAGTSPSGWPERLGETMKARKLLFLGLGLAVIIFAGAITLNLLPGKQSGVQGDGSAAAPPVSQSASPASPPAANQSSKASPTAQSTAPATTASLKPKITLPVEGGGPALSPDPGRPLEVNSPAPSATQVLLPSSKPQLPLVVAPLPQSADAAGKLAPGYPEQALPALEGSKIISSSVSPQNAILQTSLVANTAREPLAVKAFYQAHFAPLGFGSTDAPASAGSTATWFTRGTDKVTVTVTPIKGGASYIVYGVLHAGK
ncbi:hypothetical protein ABIB48_002700 [Arthrobacter sp. UYCu511]